MPSSMVSILLRHFLLVAPNLTKPDELVVPDRLQYAKSLNGPDEFPGYRSSALDALPSVSHVKSFPKDQE